MAGAAANKAHYWEDHVYSTYALPVLSYYGSPCGMGHAMPEVQEEGAYRGGVIPCAKRGVPTRAWRPEVLGPPYPNTVGVVDVTSTPNHPPCPAYVGH